MANNLALGLNLNLTPFHAALERARDRLRERLGGAAENLRTRLADTLGADAEAAASEAGERAGKSFSERFKASVGKIAVGIKAAVSPVLGAVGVAVAGALGVLGVQVALLVKHAKDIATVIVQWALTLKESGGAIGALMPSVRGLLEAAKNIGETLRAWADRLAEVIGRLSTILGIATKVARKTGQIAKNTDDASSGRFALGEKLEEASEKGEKLGETLDGVVGLLTIFSSKIRLVLFAAKGLGLLVKIAGGISKAFNSILHLPVTIGKAILNLPGFLFRASVSIVKTVASLTVKIGAILAKLAKGALVAAAAIGAALVAAFGVAAKLTKEAADAARDYNKTLVVLEASLRSLAARSGEAFSRGMAASMEKAALVLSRALGAKAPEILSAFSTFLNRGATQRQAMTLAALAGNVAKATGKDIADVAKTLADAWNGEAEAIKELGLQIVTTGNAAVDGQNAIKAAVDAYGSVGTKVVTPFEKLQVVLGQLVVSFGLRVLPAIQAAANQVYFFVRGLLGTAEGQKILDRVGRAVAGVIGWLGQATRAVLNFGERIFEIGEAIIDMIQKGAPVAVEFVKKHAFEISEFILSLLQSVLAEIPGGNLLANKLNLKQLQLGFVTKAKLADDRLQNNLDGLSASHDRFRGALRDDNGQRILGAVDRLSVAGERIARAEEHFANSVANSPLGPSGLALEREKARQLEELRRLLAEQWAATNRAGRPRIVIVNQGGSRFRRRNVRG